MPYDANGNWKLGRVMLAGNELPKQLPHRPPVDSPQYDLWAAIARKMAASPPADEQELDKFRRGLYGK